MSLNILSLLMSFHRFANSAYWDYEYQMPKPCSCYFRGSLFCFYYWDYKYQMLNPCPCYFRGFLFCSYYWDYKYQMPNPCPCYFRDSAFSTGTIVIKCSILACIISEVPYSVLTTGTINIKMTNPCPYYFRGSLFCSYCWGLWFTLCPCFPAVSLKKNTRPGIS